MGYSWDELHLRTRLLYLGYKNRYGISVREALAKNKGISYSGMYHRLKRMTANGLFQIEKLPRREEGGCHPIIFVVTKKGLLRIQQLKARGVLLESYDDKHWRLF